MVLCALCCDADSKLRACPSCNTTTCRQCERTAILNHTHDARCVACGRAYDTAEAIERLGRAFWSCEYRSMRRRRLFLSNQGKIRALAPRAAREKERRRLCSTILSLQRKIRSGDWEWVDALRETQMKLHELRRNARRLEQTPCVRCAGCGGTYDAETNKCLTETCQTITCVRCGEEGGVGHACNEDNVRSVEFLRTGCRHCPQCGAASFREHGCSVMWCVSCHVFWNWESRTTIETTRTPLPHNPDHQAWLARVGTGRAREVDDIPCGGFPDGTLLHNTLIREFVKDNQLSGSLPFPRMAEEIMRATEALYAAQRTRTRYPRVTCANQDATVDGACMAFLVGETSEAQLANALERAERTRSFHSDVGEVLETLVLSGVDVLQCFVQGDDCATTVSELRELRSFIVSSFRRLEVVHGRKGPRLSESWVWTLPNTRRAPP